MADIGTEMRADALLDAGLIKQDLGDVDGALLNWSTVFNMRGASAGIRARAGLRRSLTRSDQGDSLGAIQELDRVLSDVDDLPPDERYEALFNRGVVRNDMGDYDEALADWQQVVDAEDAPVALRASALNNRGLILSESGETEAAVTDFTAALELPELSVAVEVDTRMNRGLAHRDAGNLDAAVADFDHIIGYPELAMEPVARAIMARGDAKADADELAGAIDDWGLVLEADVPADLKAKALLRRGNAHERSDERKLAATDYQGVLELDDVSERRVLLAVGHLARALIASKEYESALAVLTAGCEAKPDDAWLESSLALATLLSGDAAGAQLSYATVLPKVRSTAELDALVSQPLDRAAGDNGVTVDEAVTALIAERREELEQEAAG
jgi:tetratricopeptide (TPR) repeat protein